MALGDILWTPASGSARPPARPPGCSLELGSSFLDAYHSRRARPAPALLKRQLRSRRRRGLVVAEMGGQYEDGFDDVRVQLINYFTYKAARTVLHQLYEMNPPSYMWLYKIINHLMVNSFSAYWQRSGRKSDDNTRHLYGKWTKKCDHAKTYQQVSDENLQPMETVIWPSDDTNTQKFD
ncbi:hypothetical protein OPV22_007417 [Ensete ventricosum]|uniref:Uncharacterized protein n=1 Tax=Ensete ventricosum TaxID=4639 RepID=A0AAV8Q8J2_ENSVE|nr:hypothetical protein OPV22_007417 [Ensete ventricosum]